MKLEGIYLILENNFRYNTRLWRMRKGLSQRAISKLLGHEETNIISNYERDALIGLDQDTKHRYADILGIPIQALYKEPVEMPVHLADIDQTVCRINLEEIRKAHGKSITEFAEQIGVSSAAYSSYIHGSIISLQSFWIIVDHLDIDPWLLATGKTHKEG
ncbi:helix-turn-helix transcriptional regulator [Acidaminococcus timonensis]|uniref:helix-turn-helix transcriptional regulator n=1 Tax=Acidaminococcus timonensis TaxID=1871002 RepID=UPI003076F811